MFSILNPFREVQVFDQDLGRILGSGRQAYPPVNIYVDSESIDATYDKGILKLTLLRADSDKPRKINIKTTE